MKLLLRLMGALVLIGSLATVVVAEEGVVVSTIDSAGYTYIEVDQKDQKIWIAVNEMAVKKGDRLEFDEGMTMSEFRSNTLQRTFPSMRFVREAKVIPEKK